MSDLDSFFVVCLLVAVLIRIFWRTVLNLLLVIGLSLVFAAIFVAAVGVQQLVGWS
jgi:hypothetical protein